MTASGPARRIRADLEASIRSGAWPPGHRLPTEQVLAARYGCARMTVSKAVGALASEGLVERNRRAGSVVGRPQVQTAVLEIPDIGAVIAARGEAYAFRLLSRRVRAPDPGDGDEAALSPGGDLLALAGVHVADGAPFALEARVIDLAAVPTAVEVDFSAFAPGSWLLDHAPWTQARHRISAVGASAETARGLGVTRGLACLQVKRWTFRLGQGVTFVRQTFPGHRYDLLAEFAPAP